MRAHHRDRIVVPRLRLPVDRWPPALACAWQAVRVQPANPFRRTTRVLRSATYHSYAAGLARYLAYLEFTGQSMPSLNIRDHVTMAQLDGYFLALRDRGCSDQTILTLFSKLRGAMHLLFPTDDVSFITRPHGIPLKRTLVIRRRDLFIPDARVTALWAADLFQSGLMLEDPMQRRLQIRDAVMLAILATRAPRARAMISLRLDRNLKHINQEWVLIQEGPMMKNQRTVLELPLGARVSAMVDRYLSVERDELLQDQQHQELWIANHGGPMSLGTMDSMIAKRSKIRFGTGFGPHRFRTSLTTTRAVLGNDHPLDAPLILGHGPLVSLQHYNRANGLAASRAHDARIDAEEDAAGRIQRSHPPGSRRAPLAVQSLTEIMRANDPKQRLDQPVRGSHSQPDRHPSLRRRHIGPVKR